MKLKKGICNECAIECDILGVDPPERWIVNKSKNLCKFHKMVKSTKFQKTIRRASLKKHFKKATGEGILFKEIWEAVEPEQRVSFVTGLPLPDQHEMRSYYFSHVLTKGSRPELRLVKENIVFMTLEEHQLWETGKHKIKADPKLYALWKHVFELAEKLKAWKP